MIDEVMMDLMILQEAKQPLNCSQIIAIDHFYYLCYKVPQQQVPLLSLPISPYLIVNSSPYDAPLLDDTHA